jgi:RHS repeat-associated protein
VTFTIHRKPAPVTSANRAANAGAVAPSPPFNQCPPVGADTSCAILVQATTSGDAIFYDPSQGPYDGSDDTLIGVLNSSNSTITRIAVSADTPLFAFDLDGLCTASPSPSGCPFGPTGYEGPNTSFSDINANQTGGVVNFTGGLAPGATAYFSLEEPLTSVVTGGPTAAEQGGASNTTEKPTTCSTPRPVNCATGVFWHTFTDFSVPGRGVPLSFTRTYSSSRAAIDGPLGFGWTDSYNMSLATDTSGNVTITQENGSAVPFASNGGGTFTPPPRVLATLVQNADGSYTFTRDTGQISYTFSASGQLTKISDLNGYTTTLAYTGGNLTSVTDPAGRRLTFTYTGSHIATVTDPMGRTMSFSYNGSGNLVKTTDALGRTWSFIYDSSHQMLTMTDPRGGATSNTYNPSGQVTAQTDPNGGTTTFSYTGDATTPAGGTTTLTDPNGNVTSYVYADLELMSVTYGAGTAQAATTSYTYDPATLGLTSVTDPNGNVTTHTYDSSGNLLSTTDSLGNITSYTYNSLNDLTSKTTPLGETTTYTYDSSGNLLSVTDPLGNTTSYSYSDSAHPGDVTAVTDPNSHVTRYTYDANGNLATVSVSPSIGVTDITAYAHDADSERTCQASPDATAAGVHCPPAGSPPVSDTTVTTYNAAGEATSVADPNGHTTSYVYDGDGNVVQITDPNGNVTKYAFDGNNQLTKITLPNGTTKSTAYDANGNVLTQTDPAGDSTRYTYDALNRPTSMTNALGQTTSYTYDAAGNRTSITDPSGAVTTFSYDQANKLTGVSYSDGATPNVSYSYDADGHRVSMTDGTGTTSSSYDAAGRLTSVTDGGGNTVSYGYDPAGNMTTLTYPNGKSVTRVFNGASQLTGVTDWLGHTTRFSYDPTGNLTRQAYPNGVTASSTFDNADQLTSITDKSGATTLASFSYGYDNSGLITSATPSAAFGGPQTYTYTPLSQLASSNSGAFTYDAAGNLTGLVNGTTQTFNVGDELTSSQVPASTKAPAVDQEVSANQTSHGSKITSPPISTLAGNELLLAFISASGPSSGSQTITGVTGGGLVWKKVARANKQAGTAEIWEAYAATPVTGVKTTAALGATGQDGSITVAAFTGAAPVTGALAVAGGDSKHPAVSLTTTHPHSLVWAAGEDATSAGTLTPAAGQTVLHQDADSKAHATYWAQDTTKPAAKAKTTLTMAGTLPATGHWNLAAVEIPSATATTATTSYTYNSNGDLTKIAPSNGPATKLTYDQANRLTAYGSASYAYNGDGLLMAKTAPGGASTQYTWDASGTLPLLLANGPTYFIYGPGGQPIEHIQGSTVTYLHIDQEGSVRLLTNSAGHAVGTYNYTAYGAVTKHTGTATSALQYDGQMTDSSSGLIYLRARYYNPMTGQFLSADPLVQETQQRYGYAGDDPLNASDPTGELMFTDCYSAGFTLSHMANSWGLCFNFGWSGYSVTATRSAGFDTGEYGASAANTYGASQGVPSPSPCSCSIDVGGSVKKGIGFAGSVSRDCDGTWGASGGLGIGTGPGATVTATVSQTLLYNSWGQWLRDWHDTIFHPTTIWRGLGL